MFVAAMFMTHDEGDDGQWSSFSRINKALKELDISWQGRWECSHQQIFHHPKLIWRLGSDQLSSFGGNIFLQTKSNWWNPYNGPNSVWHAALPKAYDHETKWNKNLSSADSNIRTTIETWKFEAWSMFQTNQNWVVIHPKY